MIYLADKAAVTRQRQGAIMILPGSIKGENKGDDNDNRFLICYKLCTTIYTCLNLKDCSS